MISDSVDIYMTKASWNDIFVCRLNHLVIVKPQQNAVAFKTICVYLALESVCWLGSFSTLGQPWLILFGLSQVLWSVVGHLESGWYRLASLTYLARLDWVFFMCSSRVQQSVTVQGLLSHRLRTWQPHCYCILKAKRVIRQTQILYF